jgi:hypothetical protein
MTPNRRELPGEAVLPLHTPQSGEQPVHQAGNHVGTQREPRRMLAAVLALDPRPLEEGRVRQDIRRGTELVEQLLGRVQDAIPELWVTKQLVCLPDCRRASARLCAGLQPTGPALDGSTANLGP